MVRNSVGPGFGDGVSGGSVRNRVIDRTFGVGVSRYAGTIHGGCKVDDRILFGVDRGMYVGKNVQAAMVMVAMNGRGVSGNGWDGIGWEEQMQDERRRHQPTI